MLNIWSILYILILLNILYYYFISIYNNKEYSSNRANSDYCNIFIYYLLQKKLFEFPVKMDCANEKAFNAVQYPFFFQKVFRIFFFDIEVRFFGTAI